MSWLLMHNMSPWHYTNANGIIAHLSPPSSALVSRSSFPTCSSSLVAYAGSSLGVTPQPCCETFLRLLRGAPEFASILNITTKLESKIYVLQHGNWHHLDWFPTDWLAMNFIIFIDLGIVFTVRRAIQAHHVPTSTSVQHRYDNSHNLLYSRPDAASLPSRMFLQVSIRHFKVTSHFTEKDMKALGEVFSLLNTQYSTCRTGCHATQERNFGKPSLRENYKLFARAQFLDNGTNNTTLTHKQLHLVGWYRDFLETRTPQGEIPSRVLKEANNGVKVWCDFATLGVEGQPVDV
eukprot:5628262-Amphidinium_carterae.1